MGKFALGGYDFHPLAGEKLSLLTQFPFWGQAITGTEQPLHRLLGQMHMAGGDLHRDGPLRGPAAGTGPAGLGDDGFDDVPYFAFTVVVHGYFTSS